MNAKKNMGLSNFLSLEFFGFGSSSHHEEKQTPQEESIYTWIMDHTKNGKLNPDLKPKDGTVVMRGEKASMFVRNGKEIDHVLNEFKKDLHVYESIFKSNKSMLEHFGKDQSNFNRDLDHIASPSTSFEQVRDVILKYKDAARRYSGPNSIAAHFREPADRFLGDYPHGFLSGGDYPYFNSSQEPNNSRDPVELQPIAEKELNDYVKLGMEIQKLQMELADLDEEVGMAIDHTDSPLRGFYSEISDSEELMNILNPFSEHGMVHEDHNAGLVDVLVKRIDYLYEAFWSYIRHSVH